MGAKTFFITGGNGWLGKRVVSALILGNNEFRSDFGDGGNDVICMVPPGENCYELIEMGAKVVFGLIQNKEEVARHVAKSKPEIIIHIAGIIHPKIFTNQFDEINFQGTKNIFESAKKYSVSRLIVMSSNSPFGGNKHVTDLFDEESPYNPYMGYGKSKARMERMLLGVPVENNALKIVVIRAPWFYGPGQPPRQTQFFSMIKDGKFPIVGSGDNKRSMAYVDSIAFGILLAANFSPAKNEVFWIADEKPYSMNEIIATVRTVLKDDFGFKVKEKAIHLPSVVADTSRFVDGLIQSLGLYNQKIHVLSEMNMTIACNITKAQRVLGYQPLVELREGMRRSVEWCIQNNMKI